jgi:hypothetical protein
VPPVQISGSGKGTKRLDHDDQSALHVHDPRTPGPAPVLGIDDESLKRGVRLEDRVHVAHQEKAREVTSTIRRASSRKNQGARPGLFSSGEIEADPIENLHFEPEIAEQPGENGRKPGQPLAVPGSGVDIDPLSEGVLHDVLAFVHRTL